MSDYKTRIILKTETENEQIFMYLLSIKNDKIIQLKKS